VVILLFFIGALAKILSLRKAGMLGCVAINVALPYQTALGGLIYGCLSLGFLTGVEPLEQVVSQKWSSEQFIVRGW
jgi:hypothetical protein